MIKQERSGNRMPRRRIMSCWRNDNDNNAVEGPVKIDTAVAK